MSRPPIEDMIGMMKKRLDKEAAKGPSLLEQSLEKGIEVEYENGTKVTYTNKPNGEKNER